jgi:uncharacterized protein DUF4407
MRGGSVDGSATNSLAPSTDLLDRIADLLARIGGFHGASSNTIAFRPERHRCALLGVLILIVALVSSLAVGNALIRIVGAPKVQAIAIALIAGLFIFVYDTYLVYVATQPWSRLWNVLATLLRVLVAFLIGAALAALLIPFALRADVIAIQLEALRSDPQFSTISDLEERRNQLTSIASNPPRRPVEDDPEVRRLTAVRSSEEEQYRQAEYAVQQEIEGLSRSKRINCGQACVVKKSFRDDQKREFDLATANLNAATGVALGRIEEEADTVARDASSDLGVIKGQIEALYRDRELAETAVRTGDVASLRLIPSLEIATRMVTGRPWAAIISVALLIAFTTIAFPPVLLNVLTGTGTASGHDSDDDD